MKFDSSAVDKLRKQAAKLTDAQLFNSIEWQLTQHGEQLSRGSTVAENVSLPTEPPIYRIYSMTKPVVSFLAMQLIDEGKLSLDDRLSQYIPIMSGLKVLNSRGAAEDLQQPITIAHLLTHTAGFSYDFLPDCAVAEQYRNVSLSGDASRSLTDVIGMLTTMPLAFQPGKRWYYSVATDVLAYTLENITGLSLPELMQTRIFNPLDMHDTAFFVPENKRQRLLPLFGARDLGQVMFESDAPNKLTPVDVSKSYPIDESSGFYRGGHGLYSTLDDYYKFMHVLATGQSQNGEQLLSENTLELMWRDHLDASFRPLVLGFNVMGGYSWHLMGSLMVDPAQCEFKTAVGAGGWSGAASTYFWIDRTNGISGISMSQYIGSTTQLGPLMQHAAYGMFKP